MAKIDIPFSYVVTHLPKRKRKAVQAIFSQKVTVDIDEVNFYQAPLVLEYENPYRREKATKIYKYEEEFYAKSDYRGDSIDIEEIKPEHLVNLDQNFAVNYDNPEWDRVISVENNHKPENWEHLICEIKEKAINQAKEHIFRDGILCEKTSLPKIKASINYSFQKLRTEITIGHFDSTIETHEMVFPISQYEEALFWCDERKKIELQSHGGSDEHVIARADDLTVYRPDLIPEENSIINEVIKVASHVFKRDWELQKYNDEIIHAWMCCRSCLVAVKNNLEDELRTEELLESCLEFFEKYEKQENEKRKRYGSSYSKFDDPYYTCLHTANEVWKNRSISIINSNTFDQAALPKM